MCMVNESMIMGGFYIFVKMSIMVNVYVFYYYSNYWDNLEEFDLECFVMCNFENVEYYVYIFFFFGCYMCIGIYFVYIEIKLLIVCLF